MYESIDDTRKPWPHGYGKPLELVFGKKFQLPVLETCLRSMLVDEVCLNSERKLVDEVCFNSERKQWNDVFKE